MVKWLNRALDEVISVITSSRDYRICIELQEKMKKNQNLMDLIDKLKEAQKRYVKSNYDKSIKGELDLLEEKLQQIPIYVSYMMHLEKVNDMLSYVEDDLNQFFYQLLNSQFLYVKQGLFIFPCFFV